MTEEEAAREALVMERAMRPRNLRPHEISDIMQRFKLYVLRDKLSAPEACKRIGAEFGRHETTIRALIERLRPTNNLATDYLRSQSLRMAMKVVRRANVSELIDVLSRPNIGVLEPVKQSGKDGGGFILSLATDSCGGVKVGMVANPPNSVIDYTSQPSARIGEGAEGPLDYEHTKKEVGHAVRRSPLSLQEGNEHATGLQGQYSGGGQEHEDGGDTYPVGVRSREEEPSLPWPDENLTVQRPLTVEEEAKYAARGGGKGTGTRPIGHKKVVQEAIQRARERITLGRELSDATRVQRRAEEMKRELKAKREQLQKSQQTS